MSKFAKGPIVNPSPLVSAIVPLFNGEAYLRETLESILAQSYGPVELLVVDDGSTDGGSEIAQGYPGLRYFRQERSGVAAARNRGVTEAKGHFIALLDQDDLWLPEKLAIQVDYLERHPDRGYVMAHERLFFEPNSPKPLWIKEELIDQPHPAFNLGATLISRDFFDKVGFFDPTFRYASDSDWFFRAQDLAPRVFLPEVLLLKRGHQNNESHHNQAMQTEMLKIMLQRTKRIAKPGAIPREGE